MKRKRPTTPQIPQKTMIELADEYEAQIPILEKVLEELNGKYKVEPYNAYILKDICTVEDMLCDIKRSIHEMRYYYEK